MKITIEPYDEAWAKGFAELEVFFREKIGTMILGIHHVGSTSVPGLPAKPIIDLDLVIDSRDEFPQIKSLLEKLGYNHVGDFGIEEREAFRVKGPDVPYADPPRTWPLHYVYVCTKDNIALRNHLCFRDYLRANPGKAQEYAALKKKLASQHSYDIDAYVEGKSAFVTNVLRLSGFSEELLASIRQQNKAKK